MALGQYNKIQSFSITQFFSVLTSIIFISIHYSQGYNIYPFLICSPTLVLLISIQYASFWRRDAQQFRCFFLTNIILLLCASVCFFSIYFGVFDKTLSYTLEKVQNCQIIGSMSSNLSGDENYTILYVNYQKNGQSMLGYGCKSNLSDADLFQSINPSDFYFYNSKIPCKNSNGNSNRLLLENSLKRDSKSASSEKQDRPQIRKRNLQSSSGCMDFYQFSEVKLPSWMCMPSSTTYQDMLKQNTCYISSYYNQSFGQKDKPQLNSYERKPLKKISSFMIVEFKDLSVPLKFLIPLIILTFYPFIVSTNVLTFFFAQFILKILYNSFTTQDKNFEQQQILQNQLYEVTEKQMEKEISLQTSSSTVPSKQQSEDGQAEFQQPNQYDQNERVISSRGKNKSLSEDDIKQLKIKFQSQLKKQDLHKVVRAQVEEEEEVENNKENQNKHNISDSELHKSQNNSKVESIHHYKQYCEIKKLSQSNISSISQTKMEQSNCSNLNNLSEAQLKYFDKTPERNFNKLSIHSSKSEQQNFVDENYKTNVHISEGSPVIHHSPFSHKLNQLMDHLGEEGEEEDQVKL